MTNMKLSKILTKFGPEAEIVFATPDGQRYEIAFFKRVIEDGKEVVIMSDKQLPA